MNKTLQDRLVKHLAAKKIPSIEQANAELAVYLEHHALLKKLHKTLKTSFATKKSEPY